MSRYRSYKNSPQSLNVRGIAKILLSVLLFFLGGFAIARFDFQKKETPPLHFKPTPYPIQNQYFVITVVGSNNGASVEKTLRSILSQNYENFRVIYVDDASTDGSFERVQGIIHDSPQEYRVSLLQNETELGVLVNLSKISEMCSEEEIMVVVGGEDLLAHEWVLQRLNQYYADQDLWMTSGNYMEFPTFTKGEDPSRGLKTFYASLFKNMERAEGHTQYIPEILYLVTSKTF